MPNSDAADLLRRISAQPLCEPGGAPQAFECKLAEQQAWTLGYTLAVVDEYRRFLVLTQVAGHLVCPSEAVDAAWHLHLTQTRAYRTMCDEVLGRFVHHDPSNGGPAELARHRTMYTDTLKAYAAAFGHAPRGDIWPGVQRRFSDGSSERGVEPLALRTWMPVPLATFLGAMLPAFAIGWLLKLAGLFGGAHLLSGPQFAWCYLMLIALLGAAAYLAQEYRGLVPPESASLDPYEAAWLAGGAPSVAATALAALIARGEATIRAGAAGRTSVNGPHAPVFLRARDTPQPGGLADAEWACLQRMRGPSMSYANVRHWTTETAAEIARRLAGAGLASSRLGLPLWRARLLVASMLLMALAWARLLHATASAHPTTFLVILMVLQALLTVALSRRQRCTRLGARALADARENFRSPASRRAESASLTMGFALLGCAELAHDERFAGFASAIGPAVATASDGDGGGGGGCGGGGGGGGGGCGG